MDAATGLIYVGNGQYYDPATGRFLTRQVNPNSTNPYVPWNFDPAGSLIGPLALLSLLARRKRGKPSKIEPYLFLLVFLVVLPLSVGLACGQPGPGNEPPVPSTETPPPTQTPGSGNDPGSGTPTPPPPLPNLTPDCPTPPPPSPTPMCEICNSNQYAQMLLTAILKYQNNLPSGFSVALLLAMAAVETGGLDPAYQNSPTHGGALQLREESGHYHPALYTNTPEGYDQNVVDAIAVINKSYLDAESTKDNLLWKLDLYDKFPNNHKEATAARAVLYYNAGFGWWLSGPEYPYSYVNEPDNKPYVGKVAGMLANYVPNAFGVSSDPSLVSVLERVQLIVNETVK